MSNHNPINGKPLSTSLAILLVIFLLENRTAYSFTARGTLTNIEKFRYTPCKHVNTPNCKTLRNSHSIQRDSGIEKIDHAERPVVVVVVGGGVGGFACASRIAYSCKQSHTNTKVLVLEKNSKEMVGGRCGSFYRDVEGLGIFRHERGPSLLLLKDIYLDLFSDCDKRAADYGLEFKQCTPAYQVVFEDGDTIQLGFPSNLKGDLNIEEAEQRSKDKMNSYEKNGAAKWDEYMQSTEAFLNCGLPNFIEEKLDLASFPAFLIESMKDGMKSWPLKPHSEVLDSLFDSTKMKTLASFQDLYVGLEPYANNGEIGGGVMKKTAPAVFGLLAAIELHPTNKKSGVFAPIGGFQAVSRAFEELATDCGVEVMYNRSVTNISTKGVWFQDEDGVSNFIAADLVVCNADLPFATETLMDSNQQNSENLQNPRYDWDDNYQFSSGVIAFHWSINKCCNSLETHNVFLIAEDRNKAESSWNTIRYNDLNASSLNDEFNFYVHRASKTDQSAAPEECDSIMVLVPCCTLQRDKDLSNLQRDISISGYQKQFNDEFVSDIRTRVLNRLAMLDGLKDLKDYIVDEVVETPAQYADYYNLAAGTPFALSHGFGQLSITRPGHQSKNLDNVLFVGASTKPGNGVPLVLIGAKQVANKAIEKLKTRIQ